MKKQLVISFSFLGALFFSCSENEHPLFPEETTAIYFELYKDKPYQNLVPFSFVGQEKDTVKVPLRVKIMGSAVSHERTFKAKVIESVSSAKRGIDYDISVSEFIVPADSFISYLPVTVYKTPELQDTTLSVAFQLLPSDDFELGINYSLIAALSFTNNLTKPSYWTPYGNIFFGSYSRTKHELIIARYNILFPEEQSLFLSQGFSYLSAIGTDLNLYFKNNYPVYDEDEQIIEPWK